MSENNQLPCNPEEIGCPFGRGEWTPERECLFNEACTLHQSTPQVSYTQPNLPATVRTGGNDSHSVLVVILFLIVGIVLTIKTLLSEPE